jgi:tetratricopeptide (TPR) repeat protein
MKKIIATFTTLISFHIALIGQVDNLSKNTRIADSLEKIYKTDLETMPNSAVPHWKYANNLTKVTFMAYYSAGKHYEKAISIDSTNADIYFDYGKYLSDNRKFTAALACFDKALTINPKNDKAIQAKSKIVDVVKKDELYKQLRILPTTTKDHKRDVDNYSNIANFDTMFSQTNDPKSKNHYPLLLEKFKNNPDSISNIESYMLILGHTQQKNYKPYNYEDEQNIQKLTYEDKIDEAILIGEKLLKEDAINLLVLREMLYCYKKQNNKDKATEYEKRIIKIFEGILASGNGSCEQPFIIISVQEEYLFVNYIGYYSTKNVTQTNCDKQMSDKMKVLRKSDEKEDYIHFNIGVIFKSIGKK